MSSQSPPRRGAPDFRPRLGPAPAKAPPRAAVVLSSWLRRLSLRAADRMLPAHLSVLEHSHGFAKAHILSTMAELGVADRLAGGPKSADELAAAIGCDSEALHRLLRASAVFGMVRLAQDGRFRTTRFTRVLRAGDPSGTSAWCRYIGSVSTQAAWADLTESVRTGGGAFGRVHGMSMFDWFAVHPEEGHNFSAGLGGLTRSEAPAIVAGYPFPRAGVICDVGGGHGVLLAAVLTAHPSLTGILVDSGPVLEQASSYLDAQGVSGRVQLSHGDLFGRSDAVADVYLLKWILHDWDDPTCAQIVRTVGAAMPEGARLVVIEGDQPHGSPDPRFSMIDLQMLVVTEGGRERSSDHLMQILAAGGLVPGRTYRTSTGLAMLEATKPHPSETPVPPR